MDDTLRILFRFKSEQASIYSTCAAFVFKDYITNKNITFRVKTVIERTWSSKKCHFVDRLYSVSFSTKDMAQVKVSTKPHFRYNIFKHATYF